MLPVSKDEKHNSKPNWLIKNAEEAVLLLKERLCDLVELIINGLTGKKPDDSLVQSFSQYLPQLSGLLLYSVPALFHSSTLCGTPVWRSSALPTLQQIYSLLYKHIANISSLYIHTKSELHRSLHYSDQEILQESQIYQCKLLLVNRNISNLSWWIYLHTVEGSEHPLGGVGRRVNTKLLIAFLFFLFGVKIFLRYEFLVWNYSQELQN